MDPDLNNQHTADTVATHHPTLQATGGMSAKPEALIALVCKSGGEYAPRHVEWLLRQLSQPTLILTDFPSHMFSVPVQPLKHGWRGWWSKMELFRPDLPDVPLLFMDLDTVVRRFNPDWLKCESSVMLTDFRRPTRAGSGMMLLQPRDRAIMWHKWMLDPISWQQSLRGDQDFISPRLTSDRWQRLFPGEIISYKDHYLKDAKLLQAAGIVCFHGKPRPWNCAGDHHEWIPPLNRTAVYREPSRSP